MTMSSEGERLRRTETRVILGCGALLTLLVVPVWHSLDIVDPWPVFDRTLAVVGGIAALAAVPVVLTGQYVLLRILRSVRVSRRIRMALLFVALTVAATFLLVSAATRATPHARFVQVMGCEPPVSVTDIHSRRCEMSLGESGRVLDFRGRPQELGAFIARCGFTRADAPGWYAGPRDSWDYQWLRVSESGSNVTVYSGSMFGTIAACEAFERWGRQAQGE